LSRRGPIEDNEWPERLKSHVVTAGAAPRVHGYLVESDLAKHYRFTDTALLALTGELPSEAEGAAFDVAMTFLAPLSVAEAPAHAAALARVCGARSSAILAAAAITLAERARFIVAQCGKLLDWLAAPDDALDPSIEAQGEEDRVAVQALRDALARRHVDIEVLAKPLSREAALVATLWFAGLRRPEQVETALVMASLPTVVAEAHCHDVASFREYPIKLPPFEYEDP
jgi:hypothetical protein